MHENELARTVFSLGMKIHRELGPGLLESVYEACLYHEIQKAGLSVEKQKILPVCYDGLILNAGYRIDLLVKNKLIVEIKSVEEMNELYFAQVLTYLRLSDCKLGLLINFNSILFKEGVRRVINGQLEP